MLYKQSIPLARLMFAVTEAQKYIGQHVVIEGWFRRGMRPYIEMGRLTGEDGRAHVAWSRWVHYGMAALLTIGAAVWLVGA
jgi:fumarate reductase subunit D